MRRNRRMFSLESLETRLALDGTAPIFIASDPTGAITKAIVNPPPLFFILDPTEPGSPSDPANPTLFRLGGPILDPTEPVDVPPPS